MPAKYRDIAPHMVTEHEGQPGAWWIIEPDRPPHNVILGFGANKIFLLRIDKGFEARGARLHGSPFRNQVDPEPSEYFRRQLHATFIDDSFGIAHRHDIGVENMLWSSDFPHSATFWPHSREKIAQDFEGVGEEDMQKILYQNTAKLYGFDVN